MSQRTQSEPTRGRSATAPRLTARAGARTTTTAEFERPPWDSASSGAAELALPQPRAGRLARASSQGRLPVGDGKAALPPTPRGSWPPRCQSVLSAGRRAGVSAAIRVTSNRRRPSLSVDPHPPPPIAAAAATAPASGATASDTATPARGALPGAVASTAISPARVARCTFEPPHMQTAPRAARAGGAAVPGSPLLMCDAGGIRNIARPPTAERRPSGPSVLQQFTFDDCDILLVDMATPGSGRGPSEAPHAFTRRSDADAARSVSPGDAHDDEDGGQQWGGAVATGAAGPYGTCDDAAFPATDASGHVAVPMPAVEDTAGVGGAAHPCSAQRPRSPTAPQLLDSDDGTASRRTPGVRPALREPHDEEIRDADDGVDSDWSGRDFSPSDGDDTGGFAVILAQHAAAPFGAKHDGRVGVGIGTQTAPRDKRRWRRRLLCGSVVALAVTLVVLLLLLLLISVLRLWSPAPAPAPAAAPADTCPAIRGKRGPFGNAAYNARGSGCPPASGERQRQQQPQRPRQFRHRRGKRRPRRQPVSVVEGLPLLVRVARPVRPVRLAASRPDDGAAARTPRLLAVQRRRVAQLAVRAQRRHDGRVRGRWQLAARGLREMLWRDWFHRGRRRGRHHGRRPAPRRQRAWKRDVRRRQGQRPRPVLRRQRLPLWRLGRVRLSVAARGVRRRHAGGPRRWLRASHEIVVLRHQRVHPGGRRRAVAQRESRWLRRVPCHLPGDSHVGRAAQRHWGNAVRSAAVLPGGSARRERHDLPSVAPATGCAGRPRLGGGAGRAASDDGRVRGPHDLPRQWWPQQELPAVQLAVRAAAANGGQRDTGSVAHAAATVLAPHRRRDPLLRRRPRLHRTHVPRAAPALVRPRPVRRVPLRVRGSRRPARFLVQWPALFRRHAVRWRRVRARSDRQPHREWDAVLRRPSQRDRHGGVSGGARLREGHRVVPQGPPPPHRHLAVRESAEAARAAHR